MKIDSANGYALGWGVATLTRNGRNERALGHHGSNGINQADVIILPESGLRIMVVTNVGGSRGADVVSRTKLRIVDLMQTRKTPLP